VKTHTILIFSALLLCRLAFVSEAFANAFVADDHIRIRCEQRGADNAAVECDMSLVIVEADYSNTYYVYGVGCTIPTGARYCEAYRGSLGDFLANRLPGGVDVSNLEFYEVYATPLTLPPVCEYRTFRPTTKTIRTFNNKNYIIAEHRINCGDSPIEGTLR